MKQNFPRIVHIHQALEAIKGDEDRFLVIDKGPFTVVNYILPDNQTFPKITDRNSAIRRELRGIKFDSKTGEIVSRVFEKFFNLGEREETLLNQVDITKPHIRLEKLDGSFIHPINAGSGIRFCTKAGITDVAMQVETWLAGGANDGIIDFCKDMLYSNYTPLFEWCSRENRVVVDHPENRLVLTAIRELYSGEYFTYREMVELGEMYGFEVVKKDDRSIDDLETYANSIYNSKEELTEGEVIRFDDGTQIKVKTTAYINLHRTKDKISKERNLVAVLLDNQLDDLKSFMLQEDLAKVEIYEVQLGNNLIDVGTEIRQIITKIITESMTRKDFALSVKCDPLIKSIIFKRWDRDFEGYETGVYKDIVERLRDACEHEQKFERVKPLLLKGCKW